MQLESLNILLAVRQYGSIRKAADHLNMSYQNVSRILIQLEEEFGRQLFVRNSKGVTPTADGERALDAARQMVAIYDALMEDFDAASSRERAEANRKISGKLELVSSTITSNGFFNDFLVDFSLQYPRIQVSLNERDAYPAADERHLHLNILPRLATELSAPGKIVQPLLEDRLTLLVRKDSPLNNKKTTALKEIAHLPMVMIYKQAREDSIITRLLDAHHVSSDDAIYVNSITAFQKYVARGNYVGLATEILAAKLISSNNKTFAQIPLRDKDLDIYHCLIMDSSETLTPAEQCFVDAIKENFHIKE